MTKSNKKPWYKKWWGISISIIGGITLFPLYSVSVSLFHFDSVISTSEIHSETASEVQSERQWNNAQNSLSSFYSKLNLHNFEAAREYLSEDYAKNEPNYSKESLMEWALKKQSDTVIINLRRDEGLSKDTTKVFSYETQYTLQGSKEKCGEKLRAYIVFRENKWKIDTIHLDEYKHCE